ncbi:hypothetical protein Hanom_Chr09g00869651 [Helianthus anomalus]
MGLGAWVGLGCELAENVQTTTPGLGLGRGLRGGPTGGSLKPAVGRASDPMWRASIHFFLINCQATPQPKPRNTPRTRHSPMRGLELHVSAHALNPNPTIHHGLSLLFGLPQFLAGLVPFGFY